MKNLLILLVSIMILSGCMYSNESDDLTTSGSGGLFEKTEVNPDFKWSTATEWDFTVDYSELGSGLEGKKVVFTDYNGEVIHESRISDLSDNYLFKTIPDISQITLFIPSLGVSETLDPSQDKLTIQKTESSSGGRVAVAGINCNCENDAPSSGTISIRNGEEVCINKEFTGSIFFIGSGTVNICSDASIQSIYGNQPGTININSDASVTVNNWNNNFVNDQIYNEGNLTFSGSLVLNKGSISNSGDLVVKGSFSQNNGELLNYGDITIHGSTSIEKAIENDGFFKVLGSFNVNSGATLTSNCRLEAKAGMNINGSFNQGGSSYTEISGSLMVNSGSKLNFNGSDIHLKTENLMLNGQVINNGNSNLLTVYGDLTINSSGQIKGKSEDIGLCTPTFPSNNSKLDFVRGCEYEIPKSECNPNGVNTVQDTDNDGCTDDVDEFPTDPERCYTLTEPSIGYKLIAFEDLWPSKGDYDFNDLVIKSKTVYTKNAQNKFVDAKHTFIITAIGASVNNGFGIHYIKKTEGFYSEINNSVIKSATEASEVKNEANTILVTKNVFNSLSSFYKNNGVGPDKSPDTLSCYVEFNPENTHTLVADIFLFRTENPGKEIHLPNIIPTENADKSLFGTGDDHSNMSDVWYKTKENHPWALELYLDEDENFKIPNEQTRITDAYPYFVSWVTSNGYENKDWVKHFNLNHVVK